MHQMNFDDNQVPFFPNLKELTVDEYIKLDKFVKRHANTLESFNFPPQRHFLTSALAEEIFKCKNLKSLKFSIWREEDFFKIHNILREKLPRRKALTLKFLGSRRKSTVFKLPEDSTFWFNFNYLENKLI